MSRYIENFIYLKKLDNQTSFSHFQFTLIFFCFFSLKKNCFLSPELED